MKHYQKKRLVAIRTDLPLVDHSIIRSLFISWLCAASSVLFAVLLITSMGYSNPVQADEPQICEVECAECKGGLLSLSMIYDGLVEGTVQVIDRNGITLFGPELVLPGEEISFSGVDGLKMEKEVFIYIDDIEDVILHTSCSKPIAPGLSWGSFTISDGTSVQNGPICPVEEGQDDCAECRGGVLSLLMTYDGLVEGTVQVIDKNGITLFGPELVLPGGEISFSGVDGLKLEKEVFIYINGIEDVNMHISCSQPIAPGLSWGSFTISAGISVDNGPICPVDDGQDGCAECKGGVLSLLMTYDGLVEGTVQVVDKNGITLFGPELVLPGGEISFTGVDGLKMEKEVFIYINGIEDVILHTSCSRDIGPGTVWGSFTISDGASAQNGSFCPIDEGQDDCAECKGGVLSLSMTYHGDDGGVVQVIDSDGVTLFGPEMLNHEDVISFTGVGGLKMKKDVFIYIGGIEDVKLHTSCSRDIGPGTVWGSFQVIEAASADNGPICGCLPGEPMPPVPVNNFDYGDAPAPYEDAWHVILPLNNLYIGDNPPDAEMGTSVGSPLAADGDDITGIDDEGATTAPAGTSLLCGQFLFPGLSYNLFVPVTGDGFVNVWIDWNSNMVFEVSEHVVVDAQPIAGEVVTSILTPLTSVSGVMRIRFSSQSGLGSTGLAPDGEVEDCNYLGGDF